MTPDRFTATVRALPNGKFAHTVTLDGEEYDKRTSAKQYRFATLQGWEHKPQVAIRYGSKPIPVGNRIEYGRSVGNVPFEVIS